MPKTYYDSELTAEQIEDALTAIDGVVNPGNNGKVLYIENGQIKAASASRWSGSAVLEPLSVTANGDYTPPTGTDGFDSVHVAVPSATLTTKSITANGTYNASSDNADGYSSVTVAVPGGATIEPLSVTQNGTYNPPSGVDGYAPVTVNVSGSGSIVADTIEQGGFDANGFDIAQQTRIRSKNFIPVTPGQDILVYCLPSSAKNIVDTKWQISMNTYSTDDYTVPRLAFTGWNYCSVMRFTVPNDVHYIRMLIGMNGGANISPSDVSGAWVVYL